jgi:hypothetical protein
MRDADTIDPPDFDHEVLCSVAGCGQSATRQLTATIFACSAECEKALHDDLWCPECHACVGDGDDHDEYCEAGIREEMASEHSDYLDARDRHESYLLDVSRGK